MGARRRSWWGWGWEDEALSTDQLSKLAAAVSSRLGADVDVREPASLSDLDLRPPRTPAPPASLADVVSTDTYDRAAHTYGKSFRDVVRGFHGDLPHPPDVVAFPRDEADVCDLLGWCADADLAAVPYGGGSSVVGGVDGGGDWAEHYGGVVSIDLTRLDRVVEIDRVSRAIRVQGGALGPVLEDQLRPHGYTLRHYPQSFDFSTVGGWLATRSGGHFATNYTHIDDFVESIRTVTPAGVIESRRLPGSGAGPSPDRLLLGSEGTLGVIVEAWLRVQDRPTFRAGASVRFASLDAAAAATRAVAQAGLFPANCRLLDPGEAATSAGVTDGSAVLVLGFESADHPLDAWIARAVECCADHGGTVPDGVKSGSTGEARDDTSGAWRNAFLRAPYGRDAMVAMGCVAETFETACTWDRYPELHARVVESVEKALASVCGGGTVTSRFTHVYPDGCAPYYTVLAPGTHGTQLERWQAVKDAAAEAIISAGGTITHHHAVGRDHRPWYDRQRPDLFAHALRAAKRSVDPAGLLNPGVLVDPLR
jgi:alkyldihydroxyacetonephosphate synthase